MGLKEAGLIVLFLALAEPSCSKEVERAFDIFTRMCCESSLEQVMLRAGRMLALQGLNQPLASTRGRGTLAGQQNVQVWSDELLKVAKKLHKFSE
jgi:hypothetical protein